MLQTLLLGSSALLALLASYHLYRASPQQHWPGAPPGPARARRLVWRYALAASLTSTLALSGYGILLTLTVAMTALGLLPLIPLALQQLPRIYPPNPFPACRRWLNRGEPHPAWLAKIAAATLLGFPSCVLLATAYYQWQRDNGGETVRYLAMWHGSYLWLALLIATSLAKNGRAACKQHLVLLLIALTLYRLSA